MSKQAPLATHAAEKNWLPILELAVEEVFEIMLGTQLKPIAKSECETSSEFRGMVGLAGAMCGILTLSCDGNTAREIAARMLGPEIAAEEDQVPDALGEICNMIAGNFKNKLAGTDGRCMLSVPTVIQGEDYRFYSMGDGELIETAMLFENAPVIISLQLNS